MSALKFHYEFDETYSEEASGRYSEQTVLPLIQSYLDSDGELFAEKIATTIIDMIPVPPKQGHRGAEVNLLACMIYEISQQVPYHHPAQVKLVRLLSCLARSKKIVDAETLDGDVFCQSLFGFTSQLRDMHFPFFEDSADVPKQFSNYINFNAFLARLMDTSLVLDERFAVWTIKYAIENDQKDDEVYSCLVSSAALWILCAGQGLFVRIVQAPATSLSGGEVEDLMKPGPLYQGPSYGMARWKFWRKGFEAVMESQNANDESKRLARKAADLMIALERAMSW